MASVQSDTANNLTSSTLSAELKKTERDVEEKEKQINYLFENMTDGFALCEIICDEKNIPYDYRILEVNKAYEEQCGIKGSDIIGKTVLEFFPDIEKSWIEIYGEIALTQKPRTFINFNHNTARHYKTSAFSPKKGQFALLFRDTTERKQKEQSLIDARDEAEHANKAKSEFLSSMSHELRTPLHAVLGYAQLLEIKDDDQFTEDNRDQVKEILHGGRHLLDLINDVLDLSKIEAGHMDISIEKIRLNEMLQKCMAMIQPLADKQSIRLHNQVDTNSNHIVLVDYRRFKQVILNLLSNAVKYNHENGEVTLSSLEIDSRYIRVMIEDTGLGIDLEHKQQIFEPFIRKAKTITTVSGTGIGLTITKNLIEAMGGKVDFESTPGQGSCFWVDIPLAEDVPT